MDHETVNSGLFGDVARFNVKNTCSGHRKRAISIRMLMKRVKMSSRTVIHIWKSKLRKREDSLPTTTATPANNSTTTTTTTTTATNNNNNVIQQTNNHLQATHQQLPQTEVTTTSVNQSTESLPPPFLWVYHTNGTSTTASSQYTLYNNDQDTLVHNLQCEEPRECKGFRKNLRGKWRRLVKKKPSQQEVYTIPAELRDQLKQIYVY